jgi:predicted DNA-binding transcriptional regulator YafY
MLCIRADRLLSLLLILQAQGRVTAADLAEELEVSVRTIYRDMEALSAAGVPVYAESGPGGGCRLLPDHKSPLTGLTPDEAGALLLLGVPAPLRELGLGLDGGPRSALVHLDMPRWFHPTDQTPHLVPLAEAVQQSRRVELAYGDGVRVVDPLGLVNKAGTWYLVADTEPGVRVYRVGRIRGVVLNGRFRRRRDFDLERFWATWSEDFISSRPRISVTVRASPGAIHALPEVLGDAVRPLIDAAGEPDHDGWRVLTLTFEHALAAAYRLAGFGADIEVIRPAEVRERVLRTAAATVELYRAPG